jgi:hypothetical protein
MAQVDDIKPPRPVWPQRPGDGVKGKQEQPAPRHRQKKSPGNESNDDKDGHAVDEYA